MNKILPGTLLLLALSVTGCRSPAADPSVGGGDLGLIEAAMQQVKKSYVVPVQPDQLVTFSRADHQHLIVVASDRWRVRTWRRDLSSFLRDSRDSFRRFQRNRGRSDQDRR